MFLAFQRTNHQKKNFWRYYNSFVKAKTFPLCFSVMRNCRFSFTFLRNAQSVIDFGTIFTETTLHRLLQQVQALPKT